METDKLRTMIVALFVILIVLLFHKNEQIVFDPPILLGVLNTVFLSIIPLFVAYTMAMSFIKTGDVPLLILGCGIFALGLGGLSSGWFVTGRPNITVTIYNTSAFLCAAFHITAFSLFRFNFKVVTVKTRWNLLIGSLLCLCFTNLGLIYASLNGLTPVYIVQGEGPTLFGRMVLGMAIGFFAISAVQASGNYEKTGLKFVGYYTTGLSLISIGLLGVFLQKSVGSPIGWAGRASQYIGCLFILVGILEFWRMKLKFDLSFQAAISTVFMEAKANYKALVEAAPVGIIAIDQGERIILWNKAAEEIFGYKEKEVIGVNIKTLIFPENKADVFKCQLETDTDTRNINGKMPVNQTEVFTKDGRLLSVEIYIAQKNKKIRSAK